MTKKEPYRFEVSTVDSLPHFQNIGAGQDSDPIYLPMSRGAFSACVRFYQESDSFLNGQRTDPPSVAPLLKECLPHGSIFDARFGHPDEFGEKLLIFFEDADNPSEIRNRGPRWFPPEHFAGLCLLTSPGGSIRHNYATPKKDREGKPTPKDKRRSHLSFGRGSDQNIRLLRIIANAERGTQVHRVKANQWPDAHREYRPKALHSVFDEEANAKFGRAGLSAKAREEAVKAAAVHWDKARRLGRELPDNVMTGGDLADLLRWAFAVADRLYQFRR